MDAIIETREKAKAFAEATEKPQIERKDAMKALIDELNNEDLMKDPSMEGLTFMLALDDEQFSMLAPVFVDELKANMNVADSKIMMAQTINANGMTIEDMEEEFHKITDTIQKETEGSLSQQKIDFLKEVMTINYNAVADTKGFASRVMNVPIELMNENAKIPTYAHLGDAGADVYSPEEVTILPGETKIIKTGIKLSIPKGYQVELRPRSGLSAKSMLRVANSPATIDSNFTGEIGVIITNIEPPYRKIDFIDGQLSVEYGRPYTIEKGERIAQMVLMPAPVINFVPVEKVMENADRGEGAYGSSGKF